MIQNKAYTIFHKNQILTQGHLNKVVTYLEKEDRESRIIDGSGIHFGLNVSFNDADNCITLTSGAGTTSKGYLVVNERDLKFTHYKVLELPEDSENYLLFDDKTRINDVYELLVDNKDPKDINKININAKEIDNKTKEEMAVILHLEVYDAKLATCNESCDNQGHEIQLNWRALLIKKTDLDKLLKNDLTYEKINKKYEIDEVRIPVPFFNCDNTQSYALIHYNYLYICMVAFISIAKSVEKTLDVYSRYINKFDLNLMKLFCNLCHYENYEKQGIQYFYDHLKDIAMALNEFNNAAFNYHCNCSLDKNRFPNYLMAGSFREPSSEEYKDDKYRHYFEPCCKDFAGTNQKKELQYYYERIKTIIESYNPKYLEHSEKIKNNRIVISAESRFSGSLGDINPAYYYSNSKELRMRWNPDKFNHAKYRDIPFYWDREGSDNPNNKLRFRLDRHDTFHIEGHLGMTKEAFVKAFNNIKQNCYAFPFDLKILEVKSAGNCDFEEPYMGLKELKVLFELEKEKIVCFLTSLFDDCKDEKPITSAQTKNMAYEKPEKPITSVQKEKIVSEKAEKLTSSVQARKQVSSDQSEIEDLAQINQNRFAQINMLNDLISNGEYNNESQILVEIRDDLTKKAHNDLFFQVIYKNVPYTFRKYSTVKLAEFDSIEKIHITSAIKNVIAGLLWAAIEDFKRDNIYSDSKIIENIKKIQSASIKLFNIYDRKVDDNLNKFQVLQLLNTLSNKCFYSQYLEIKLKYQEIKDIVYDEMTFSQYVQKHPGLEHNGGVPRGGTFIVVYTNHNQKISNDNIKKINNSLNKIRNYSDEDYRNFIETISDMDIQNAQNEKNEIVADFYLPYRCSKDCSSIEYVVLTELKINLPEKVCNNNDKFKIDYSPVGAKLYSDKKGLVTFNNDDKFYYCNPNFDAETYDITITFKNQKATYSLDIVDPPEADYINEDKPEKINGRKYSWTFTAKEENMKYIWYKRDIFAEKEVIDGITDEVLDIYFQIVKEGKVYTLISGDTDILNFQLVLKVCNETTCCTISKPKFFKFVPEIDWKLAPLNFCNKHNSPIVLHYYPNEAKLDGVGENMKDRIFPTTNNIYSFDPSGLTPGPHQIKMTFGKFNPKVFNINILHHPNANFILKNKDPKLEKDKYIWIFEAVDIDLEYQWYKDGNKLPGETERLYKYSWDRFSGSKSFYLKLSVTKRSRDCNCHDECTQLIHAHEADKLRILFPDTICNGIKDKKLIEYTPSDAKIDVSPKYIEKDADGRYCFIPTNLKDGKDYKIAISLYGKEESHFVKVIHVPSCDFFSHSPVFDSTKEKWYYKFISVEKNSKYTYQWSYDGKKASNKPYLIVYCKKSKKKKLILKLEVSNNECHGKPVEKKETIYKCNLFINNKRSIPYIALKNSLNTIYNVEKMPNKLKKAINEIDSMNIKVKKKITNINYDPEVVEIIKKIDVMIVTITREDCKMSEKNCALTIKYIKSNLISVSEILIARSDDSSKNSVEYKKIMQIIPKIESLFKITDSDEVNHELVNRADGKDNIKKFLRTVERI